MCFPVMIMSKFLDCKLGLIGNSLSIWTLGREISLFRFWHKYLMIPSFRTNSHFLSATELWHSVKEPKQAHGTTSSLWTKYIFFSSSILILRKLLKMPDPRLFEQILVFFQQQGSDVLWHKVLLSFFVELICLLDKIWRVIWIKKYFKNIVFFTFSSFFCSLFCFAQVLQRSASLLWDRKQILFFKAFKIK